MAAEAYKRILLAAENTVKAVVFLGDDEPPDVVRRNLPEPGEEIGRLPVVVVCPSQDAEGWERLGTDDDAAIQSLYRVDVVIIDAGGQEWVEQKWKHLAWREQIRGALQQGLPLVSDVWQTDLKPWVALDRRRLSEQFFYCGLTATYKAAEARAGDPAGDIPLSAENATLTLANQRWLRPAGWSIVLRSARVKGHGFEDSPFKKPVGSPREMTATVDAWLPRGRGMGVEDKAVLTDLRLHLAGPDSPSWHLPEAFVEEVRPTAKKDDMHRYTATILNRGPYYYPEVA